MGVGDVSRSIHDYLDLVDALQQSISPQPGHDFEVNYCEIDGMLEKIANLETQFRLGRSKLQNIRNQSRVLIPPNRLPTEIFSYIFYLCFQSEAEPVDPQLWDEDATPDDDTQSIISVGPQVCHHWRDVILGTHKLWTSIDLSSPASLYDADLALKRSKTLPLAIYLDLVLEEGEGWHKPALDLLRPHMSRCRELSMHANNLEAMGHAVHQLTKSGDMPLLRDVTLTSREAGEVLSLGETAISLFTAMTQAVDYLHLLGVFLPWESRSFTNLVGLTLTHIDDTRAPTPAQMETILRSCPLLEYLELEDIAPLLPPVEPPTFTSPSSIVMKALDTVKVQRVGVPIFHHIADVISAPALTTVLFADSVGRPRAGLSEVEFGAHSALFSLTSASHAVSLQYLSIELGTWSSSEFIRLLKPLESLQDLRLSLMKGVDNILAGLVSEGCCTDLCALTLIECYSQDASLFKAIRKLASDPERESH
ncbi:hypothetical protein BOTBODRAFT_180356 [Botryobasidium botryosum FD-172 SS1]|uniref:Uncharacterized protein n=1 Tax=Botryobasidium botryosum (strain FD-172 SS1) TaxID=930990 RepID=A0A067LX63_BOTB1|nr:hypothetical protein BOTBODRAFT_180356 [Botryobasidium botryosum FD-172 SS1]